MFMRIMIVCISKKKFLGTSFLFAIILISCLSCC